MIPKRVTDAFDSSIAELLRANCAGAPIITPLASLDPSRAQKTVATIGFACDAVRGVVLIIAPAGSLRGCHPLLAMGAPVSELELSDWAGEMANQTLGRFKSALLPYGIALKLCVPSVVQGTALEVAIPNRGERYFCSVRTPSGLFFEFGIDISFEPGFDLSVLDRLRADGGSSLKEGDSFLF